MSSMTWRISLTFIAAVVGRTHLHRRKWLLSGMGSPRICPGEELAMANNWPDGGEKPLGPIEARILPWAAWLVSTVFASWAALSVLGLLPGGMPRSITVAVVLIIGVMAAWVLRPWNIDGPKR
jgi:hypothetical protein